MALLELFSVVLYSLSLSQQPVFDHGQLSINLLDEYISGSVSECDDFFVSGPVFCPDEAPGIYDVFADHYEPNDSVSTATVLYPENHDCSQYYRMHVDANLHVHNGLSDVDFYAIPLKIDSRVSIFYDSYDECDFSVYVLKYYEDYCSPCYEEIVSSTLSEPASFSYCLSAGTYYVYLHGTTTISYYSLDVSVEPKSVEPTETISIADKKFVYGSECIVSILDYSYSHIPLFSYSPMTININNIGDNCNTIRDYTLEKVIDSLNGGSSPYCSVLVWDRGFLESIRTSIQALTSIFQTQNDQGAFYGSVISIIDYSLSALDLVVSITLSLIPAVGPAISIPVSLAGCAFHVGLLQLLKNFLVCDSTLSVHDFTFLNGLNGYLSGILDVIPPGEQLPKPILFENKIYFDRDSCSLVISPTERSGSIYSDEFFTVSYPCSLGHQMLSITEDDDGVHLLATENMSALVPQVIALSSDYSYPSTTINPGEFMWFSFNATYSGRYYFIVSDSDELLIEPFNNCVIGYSSVGLLFRPNATVTLYDRQCSCFRLDMSAGQTIYIRIRLPYDSYSSETFSLQVLDNQYVSGFVCQHAFNHRYSDVNSTYHRAYCWCGASTLQVHIWDETWHSFNRQYGHCGVCGVTRQFDTGFIKQGEDEVENEVV
ncbi:MAG: hypothetical protein MJ238_01830 [Bacilli bacterium]|nr:hypothetical protein [Bacilli bacterium]